MKINHCQNSMLSFSRFSASNSNQMLYDRTKDEEDRDTVTISLFGQNNNSRIKNLMGQRQLLLEQKNELLHTTMENGGDKQSIQDLLESYEEQLKELDQQISQEMIKQKEKQLTKEESSKEKEEAMTEEELEQKRVSNLLALSSGMSQMETAKSSKTQIEGEIRVLESEIELDKGRCGASQGLAKKEEKLAQLRQKYL